MQGDLQNLEESKHFQEEITNSVMKPSIWNHWNKSTVFIHIFAMAGMDWNYTDSLLQETHFYWWS